MTAPLPDHVLASHLDSNSVYDVFTLKFHPAEQILLAGDVQGRIHFNVFDLDQKEVQIAPGTERKLFHPHKPDEEGSSSCRSIDFVPEDNQYFVSGGSEGRVALCDFTPKKVHGWKLKNPVSVVKCLSPSLVVAGDDEGKLHAFDVRLRKKLFTVAEQTDFITSIEIGSVDSPLKQIIATSGDCTLAVYDLRKMASSPDTKTSALVAMSDDQEDEMNCALSMNGGAHLLTGAANGVVGIWKNGFWGDVKDRFPLYESSTVTDTTSSHSIEGMRKVNEKQYLAVTGDGILRVVDLFPNKIDRIIGVHRDEESNGVVATINGFDFDVDLGLVATSSGDSRGTIKFWSLQKGEQESDLEEEEPVEKEVTKKIKHTIKPVILSNPEKASKQAFFSQL